MTTSQTAAAPVFTGTVPTQTTVSEAPVTPFATTVISDTNLGAVETVTITMAGGAGTLTDGSGFAGLVLNANGSYTLTGSAAAVTSELQALVFKPAAGAPGTSTATTFTLSDSSQITAMSYSSTPLTLATFNLVNGATPYAGLVMNSYGNLFGVTQNGGGNGFGTVYALFKNSTGYSTPITLATFNSSNGANPQGTLITDAAGDLFGTTNLGGANNQGTVFELVNGSTGFGAPVTLATFNGTNGANPIDGLITDAAGDLFGTTNNGGASSDGTVFELVKNSTGFGTVVTLASFNGTNGMFPRGLTIDAAGNLYGETISGGGTGVLGTVFEMVKGSSGYAAPVTLATFNGTNGANPRGGLLIDAAGDVFGITSGGAANGQGTVFELVKSATGFSAPVTLATFDAVNQLSPRSGLIADSAGDLFGTTYNGGSGNYGSVFELVKSATGFSAPVTLTTFTGTNGSYPYANLMFDAAGNLIGTTSQGGASNYGTVFQLTRAQIQTTLATAVTTVTVTNKDPALAPVAVVSGTAPTYAVGGAAVAIAPTLTVTDVGATTLQSATVTITSGFKSGDLLAFTAQPGISGSYSATTGVLTLTGTASLATYQAALASVTYASSAQDPVFNNTDKARGLSLVVNNGTSTSTPLAITLGLTQPAGTTYTLGTSAVTIAGGAGNDVIIAAAGTLLAADVIDGGPGTNTLNLTGGGAFNLATPKTLAHIGTVVATESQTAPESVTLRAGLNATVMIASGKPVAGNSQPEAATIIGVAGDSSTIYLGNGTDTVTLGSANEAIVGSSSSALINATASSCGAWINNKTGTAALTLSGGGAVTLNVKDAGIRTVTLAQASTAWTFATDKETGQTITDQSTTKDTINLLGAGATLTLGSGMSTVDLHAGMGNDTIAGFVAGGAAHDTLQFDKTVFADWAHLLGATTQQGADLLITVDANDTVLLKNVSLAAFTSTDAKFV